MHCPCLCLQPFCHRCRRERSRKFVAPALQQMRFGDVCPLGLPFPLRHWQPFDRPHLQWLYHAKGLGDRGLERRAARPYLVGPDVLEFLT